MKSYAQSNRFTAAWLAGSILFGGMASSWAQDEQGVPEEGSIEDLLINPDGLEAAPEETQADPDGAPADPDADNNKQPTVKGKDVRVANPVAEFAGLDKITGRIISFDVYVNETVQFGALQVTPRICYSRPDAEEPKTDTFVEVDEITLDRKIRRIFTGWMFAESPGLNAVEHAVYDVWLKGCKAKSDVPPPETATAKP
jgi:hypothetical protein